MEKRAKLIDLRASQTKGNDLNAIAMSGLSQVPIVEIVDTAAPGFRPVKPNKPLNIVLGGMMGILLGVPVAAAVTWFARRSARAMVPVPAAS
jgi:uncharacterized protein involved in exopolysaccharide biosynthesis